MYRISLVALAATTLLLQAQAQTSCIETCTGSANVLTQLKSCTGCGTDDWACFCRCPQYMNALFSCTEQYCTGDAVENSIVSFCANQGVSVSYSSTSNPTSSSTGTNTGTSSGTSTSTSSSSSLSLTALPGVFSSSASVNPNAFSSSTITTSDGTSPTTFTSSTFTATDTSDVSAYLSSAVPLNAAGSNACFVNSPYSQYSTPTWYSTMPTQVQSYYSSVNQGNTAACTLSPQAAAVAGSHRSGLSAGAIAGIVIGAILAALLLLLLLLCCLRRRKRSRRDAAAANTRSRGVEPHSASMVQARQAPYTNEKPIGPATAAYAAPLGAGAYGRDERGFPNGSTAPVSNGTPMSGAGYGPNERGIPTTGAAPMSGGVPLAGGAYGNNARGVPAGSAAPGSYDGPGVGGAGFRGNEGDGLLSSATYAPASVPAGHGPGGSGVYGVNGPGTGGGIGSATRNDLAGGMGNGVGGGTRNGLGGGISNGIGNGTGRGIGGMGGTGTGLGAGGAYTENGENKPWSHTTTTTTRITTRPRPKNPVNRSPPSQPSRPAPQPIPNHGPGHYNDSPNRI